MKSRHAWLHVVLTVLVVGLEAGAAHALTLKNLRNQGVDGIFGTYAPGGDCRREPRVVVDGSGFTYHYRGQASHPASFEYAVSYMGQGYQGIGHWFFPFPLSDDDFGRVLMTVNPGEKAGTLQFEPNLAPGQSLTPLQLALVRNSPYAKCNQRGVAAGNTGSGAPRTAGQATTWPLKINFDKDKIQPTPAQATAIRRAAAADIREFDHPDQDGYDVVLADLNDDGRPDLLVQYADMAFCGSHGCSGVIVMATPQGYARTGVDLPNFYGGVDILAGTHAGMHDLQFDGDSPVWNWNGRQYAIHTGDPGAASTHAPASLPTAGGPGWQTRDAAGRTLAMAVASRSVIKTLSVFCNAGKPVLAMLVKARPPAGPVMLAFEFNGRVVKVPMGQGNREATLWLSDLSRSELPRWLAHERGAVALRINGGNQGEVSLDNSTVATQAALKPCYRY